LKPTLSGIDQPSRFGSTRVGNRKLTILARTLRKTLATTSAENGAVANGPPGEPVTGARRAGPLDYPSRGAHNDGTKRATPSTHAQVREDRVQSPVFGDRLHDPQFFGARRLPAGGEHRRHSG